MKHASCLLLTLISLTTLTACDRSPEYAYLEGETMGTSYHIRYQMPNNISEADIKADIDERLEQVNASMSTYQDDSLISEFNRLPADEVMTVGADFEAVTTTAKEVYEQSNGAFDPTVMPLVELWGFGKTMTVDRLNSPPSDMEILQAKSLLDFNGITLDGMTIRKDKDGVGLDFSAIAKGYGVDVIADVLKDYEINSYMVEIGGEVATQGVNDGLKPWQIAIDAPVIDSTVTERETIAVIRQSQGGTLNLATSGNYRNSVIFDGKRYSHTIDPTTGYPIVGGAPSVSVVADSVMLADAWATALTAMPYDKALQMAMDKGLAVMFVVPKNGVNDVTNTTSSSLEDWKVVQTPEMAKLREGD